MLTREALERMTDEERGELFDRLATQHYGTDRYGVQLGEDFAASIATIYRWKKGGVPWAVLYTLDAWTSDLTEDRKQLVWAARTAAAALLKALSAAPTADAAPRKDAASGR